MSGFPTLTMRYNYGDFGISSVSYYSGGTLIRNRDIIPVNVFNYVHGNEFIDEIKKLCMAGNQLTRSVQNLLDNKKKIMNEIKYEHIDVFGMISKGVLMLIERNDPQMLSQYRIIKLIEKTKKHNLIESDCYSDCLVCLENCENDSFKLDCTCRYSCHKKCLTKWLEVSNNCPFCKI